MKKRLIVDMDGVLADVYSGFIRLEKERYSCTIDTEKLNGVREEDAFPHYDQIVNSEGFFRYAPLMSGSIEGLRILNELYDVRVVSSATEFPLSLREKYDWLREHFSFISWRQMTFGGNKDLIKGDTMIDDNLFNLEDFKGDKIIFTQPHNVNVKQDDIQRADHWGEVIEILKQ